MKWNCEKVGIAVKHRSKEALSAGRLIAQELKRAGLKPVNLTANGIPSSLLGIDSQPEDLSPSICRVIVIGGDGTFLRLAQAIAEKRLAPLIMTVGAGRRCYFFDIDSSEASAYLEKFLKGDYAVQQYLLGSVREEGGGQLTFVNEAVLVGDRAKLARLEVYVGLSKLYDVFGDGVIVSTSTGSTAYSLSAGGPVVEPGLPAFVITPIAAIQLSNRPVVISSLLDVRVFVRKDGAAPRLIVDGIDKGYVERGKTLRFRLHPTPLFVARFKWVRFYERTFERKTVY